MARTGHGLALSAGRVAYVLGGAFLFGLAAMVLVDFPLRNALPAAMLVPLHLMIVVCGGYYGYVQSKKQTSKVS